MKHTFANKIKVDSESKQPTVIYDSAPVLVHLRLKFNES